MEDPDSGRRAVHRDGDGYLVEESKPRLIAGCLIAPGPVDGAGAAIVADFGAGRRTSDLVHAARDRRRGGGDDNRPFRSPAGRKVAGRVSPIAVATRRRSHNQPEVIDRMSNRLVRDSAGIEAFLSSGALTPALRREADSCAPLRRPQLREE